MFRSQTLTQAARFPRLSALLIDRPMTPPDRVAGRLRRYFLPLRETLFLGGSSSEGRFFDVRKTEVD
jgi:hypothetical protein